MRMRGGQPALLLLLSVLSPGLLGGPRPSYSGNYGGEVGQSMLDDIFGAGLDRARYGNTEEEWIEVAVTQLPRADQDDCQPIQTPRTEPELQELYEELQKIEVIKADGSNKCDFYRETEGFECVPYYQCDGGQIITDGAGLIDIRFGGSEEPEVAVLDATDLMCPGSLDICCKDPDFTQACSGYNCDLTANTTTSTTSTTTTTPTPTTTTTTTTPSTPDTCTGYNCPLSDTTTTTTTTTTTPTTTTTTTTTTKAP